MISRRPTTVSTSQNAANPSPVLDCAVAPPANFNLVSLFFKFSLPFFALIDLASKKNDNMAFFVNRPAGWLPRTEYRDAMCKWFFLTRILTLGFLTLSNFIFSPFFLHLIFFIICPFFIFSSSKPSVLSVPLRGCAAAPSALSMMPFCDLAST